MPLNSLDIIFFSDDRAGTPTSSMHLADQLAKRNRVFWINSYMRMPGLSWEDLSKIVKIFFRRSGKPSNVQEADKRADGLRYFTPMTIPWFISPIRKVNGILGKRFLKKLFYDYDIELPILVTTFPCTIDAFQAVRSETKQVYYCVDEWSEYPGLDHKRWETMERKLLTHIDGAAYTSRDLMARKGQNVKQKLYLPHGVDFDHFARIGGTPTKIDLLES